MGARPGTPAGRSRTQRADREQLLREQEQQLREQAELERDRERQRAELLAARLRALGIDLEQLN